MKTAKFNGIIYEVKPTGRMRKKKTKAHTDFNGYEVEASCSSEPQLGMYLNGELQFTISRFNNQDFIYRGSERYGSVTIRDSITTTPINTP